MGMVAEEEEKMGERVAHFELAAEKLKTAVTHFKKSDFVPLSKVMLESICCFQVVLSSYPYCEYVCRVWTKLYPSLKIL